MARPECIASAEGKKLIVGNWKMNGLKKDAQERVDDLVRELSADTAVNYAIVLCPPATLIGAVRQRIEDVYLCGEVSFAVGGQDCHAMPAGACTGDISAPMLADAGCAYVILGHSERRQGHGETDAAVAAKAKAAHEAGLVSIVCVGETEEERSAGRHMEVVASQIAASLPACTTATNTVIAYEPVWAIGTGKTATLDDVRAMHAHISERVPAGMAILYGGSVKPGNARDILAIEHVSGVLVGGASLVVEDFCAIARAA